MEILGYKTTAPRNRKAWRQWLEKNHDRSPGVWVIYYKQSTGKAKISYEELVEEALCFGWIDSTKRRFDDERSAQRFGPRKTKSVWSTPNKIRVARMVEKGLMTNAGLVKIEAAKKDGSWEHLENVYARADKMEMPDDLHRAFARHKKALVHFSNYAVSIRRQFFYWISTAKRPETRKARIKLAVQMAAANKKPGASGFKL